MRYDFKCKKCHVISEFDLPMGFENGSKLECPECESKEMDRIFSVPNIAGDSNAKKAKQPPCATGKCPFVKQ
ncbi:hypothetical protein GF362_03825 [Candidatus Dojkabacteria bacterium]|nr:hypothetical protein [Candidatus Dojkabacteria bacterium]